MGGSDLSLALRGPSQSDFYESATRGIALQLPAISCMQVSRRRTAFLARSRCSVTFSLERKEAVR